VIDYEHDWVGRLVGRIYQQFKDDPVLVALVRDVIAPQFQALEDAGQAVALMLSIDPVTSDPDSPLYGIGRGVQLDVIGRIVGQPRGGISDEVYRPYLRARIRTNRSSGSPDDLYAVFVALFGVTGSATILPAPPAGLIFRVDNPGLSVAEDAALFAFLRAAKDGGVRLYIETQPADDAHTFCFDGGAGLGFGDPADPTIGGEFADASVV
jgi:hypothetical protein